MCDDTLTENEHVTHAHFALHKPYGYLTQFIKKKKKRQKLLGDLYPFPEGTMAIGRLDQASEGLLLLTTDGKMSEHIRSKKITKEYYVQLDGVITNEAISQMKSGVEIGFNGIKYMTLPCEASKIEDPQFGERSKKVRDDRHGPTSWASVIISEGKYKQVRKMTAAVGFPTLRLVRVRIGEFTLGDLKVGEVRKIERIK